MSHFKSSLRLGVFLLIGLALSWGTMPALSQSPNTLESVKQVQQRHEDALFEIPGVNAVGIGKEKGSYVLHVYVNEEINPNPETLVPQVLETVPVVIIRVKGDFVAGTLLSLDDGPEHRQTFPPPVPMGVSTSNANFCAAGTLGFRARDPVTGQVGYITNNHIAVAGGAAGCPNNAPLGTDQLQAGLADTGCNNPATDIGDLDRFVPIDLGFFTNNVVDAAFVESSTALVSNEILDVGTPVGPARDPILGEFVQKSGRTSGLTTGQVRSMNLTVNVRYGVCSFARFIGQVGIAGTTAPFIQAGDSGSPMLSLNGEPVGLLFARDSSGVALANLLPTVLQELGVELF